MAAARTCFFAVGRSFSYVDLTTGRWERAAFPSVYCQKRVGDFDPSSLEGEHPASLHEGSAS